jgi:hypothetical protein
MKKNCFEKTLVEDLPVFEVLLKWILLKLALARKSISLLYRRILLRISKLILRKLRPKTCLLKRVLLLKIIFVAVEEVLDKTDFAVFEKKLN